MLKTSQAYREVEEQSQKILSMKKPLNLVQNWGKKIERWG